MSINVGFKIDGQQYNLADLAKGRQKFGFNEWWHVTWISIKSAVCLASEAEKGERDLYIAANKVIDAASKTFPNLNKMSLIEFNEDLVDCINLNAKNSNKQMSNALKEWEKVHPHPSNNNINSTESTPLILPVQVQSVVYSPQQPAPAVRQESRRADVSGTFNTKPCSREGNSNSCFVNTALQIIAHTPALFALFQENLEQGTNEKNESFQQRNGIRKFGLTLLTQLRAGTPNVGAGGQLRNFVKAVNNMPGVTEKFNLDTGDKSERFLVELVDILRPKEIIKKIARPETKIKGAQAAPLVVFKHPPVMGSLTSPIFESRNKELLDDFFARQQSPLPVIYVSDTTGKDHKMPETFNTPNGLVYQLQTVSIRTGSDGGFGHVRPAVCTPTGGFTLIDDMTGIKQMSKDDMTKYLEKNEGARVAYYVKV